MKKITVEEAIKNNLRPGDIIWTKAEVLIINSSDFTIKVRTGRKGHVNGWLSMKDEIHLPTPKPAYYPTDGETVWNKKHHQKNKFIKSFTDQWIYLFFMDGTEHISPNGKHEIEAGNIEPYTGQDQADPEKKS